MSTLGDLQTKLNHSLMNAETNLYTNEKRIDAINRSIETILKKFDVPWYTLTSSISFTSGAATLPATFLRAIKVFNSSDLEYTQVSPNDFDNDISNTWTIKWDGTSAFKLYIYPASTTSLTYRYIEYPTRLSASSDTVRFPVYWDEAIAELAAFTLLQQSRNTSDAQVKKMIADDKIAEAWQQDAKLVDGPVGMRLKSLYEDYSFLRTSPRWR